MSFLCDLMSYYVIWCHIMWFDMSYYVIWYVILCHMLSYDVIFCDFDVILCHLLSYYVIWYVILCDLICHIMWFDVILCHFLWFWCHFVSFDVIISCHLKTFVTFMYVFFSVFWVVDEGYCARFLCCGKCLMLPWCFVMADFLFLFLFFVCAGRWAWVVFWHVEIVVCRCVFLCSGWYYCFLWFIQYLCV